MSRNRAGEKMSAFDTGGSSLQEVADEIYGASAPGITTARIVASAVDINSIWADRAQPRRAVPASLRLHWNGDPADVPDLLGKWYAVATELAGVELDIVAMLKGEGEGIASDNTHSLFADFVDLVRLAQSINRDGLMNPITVVESDNRWVIESGERRWLAYHLLAMYLGEAWGKIPAQKSDGRDYVWRQAAENTARRTLNAISMARQLALLIMAARDGSHYFAFDEVVGAGDCDRRFYAQVADGNTHRIPRGMGERIQAAMGLSMEQLARYRSLLRLTDDEEVNDVLWVRADIENWAEGALREIATLPMGKVREVIQQEDWTLEKLKMLKDTLPIGKVSSAEAAAPAPALGVYEGAVYRVGDKVKSMAGMIGEVRGINGRLIQVATPYGLRDYYPHQLTKVENPLAAAPAPLNEAAHEAEPLVLAFTAGEAVMIVETEEVGKILRRRPDGLWAIELGSGIQRIRSDMEIVSLGRTWDEFVAEAEEDESLDPYAIVPELTEDADEWDDEPEDDQPEESEALVADINGLYPVEPSPDAVVEKARQIALEAVGNSEWDLNDRIKGRMGHGDRNMMAQLGGGYIPVRGHPLPLSRNQVGVRLLVEGRERLFRFNAFQLLRWKLNNRKQAEASDKTDSVEQPYPTITPALDSASREIVAGLAALCAVTGDMDGVALFSEMAEATVEGIESLAESDELLPHLNRSYVRMSEFMARLDVVLTELLNQMAREGGYDNWVE